MLGERPMETGLRAMPVAGIGLVLIAALVVAVMVLMTTASPDLWTAALIAMVLFVVSLPALHRQAAREGDPRVVGILTLALAAKLAASFVRYHVAFGLYGGVADAAAYHNAALDLYPRIRALNLESLLTSSSTDFIRAFTGAVYAVFTPTRLGGFVVFSWLGFWGLFLLYRAFVIATPEGRIRTYRLLLFFLPSLLFWPSSVGKEAWMVCWIGLAAYGAARFLTGDTFRGLVAGGAGLALAALVRPHVAAMLAIAAVIAYVIRPAPEEHRELGPVLKVGVVGLLAVSCLVLVTRTERFLTEAGVNDDGTIVTTLKETMFRTQQGGSGFQPSIVDSPARAPLAAVTVLFRPLLPEARNLQGALAALEGTALLLLSVWRWRWILAALKSVRRQPYVALAAAYAGVFIIGFSAIANFGMLARQRVQMLPFYLVLLAIPPGGGESDARRPTVADHQAA
jgi:hypothetical protein